MSLRLVVTIKQEEAARAWVRNFYNGFDSPDIHSWITQFYQPDAILNVGNQPPFKGHKDISGIFEKEREQLSIVKHDIIHVDVFSDRIYVQMKDTFIVKNDPELKGIKIKSLVVIWKKIDEDKLSSMDVYFDPTPLTERIKMIS